MRDAGDLLMSWRWITPVATTLYLVAPISGTVGGGFPTAPLELLLLSSNRVT